MTAALHHHAAPSTPSTRLPGAGVPSKGPITFFCPACWERVTETEQTCPACGVNIPLHLAQTDYGAKLIAALQHPDAGRRMLAAWLLGERREPRAVPALRTIILTEKRDVYMAKAAATALINIGGIEAEETLHWARNCHPALIVRTAAARAFIGSPRIR